MFTTPEKYFSLAYQWLHDLLQPTKLLTLFALLVLFGVSSCEKVINVDLNDAEKKYVIEANITDQDSSCKVLLTQSKEFTDDNSFPGISGALVTISDNGQSPVTLTESSPGVYVSLLKGVPGHTYSLQVNINGIRYSAISAMPAKVPFDSLTMSEVFVFGEINKLATVNYAEPLGIGNSYRFIQHVNGVKEKTIFITNDDYSDGRVIADNLFFFGDDDDVNDGKIIVGDTVQIQMQCIDKPMYTYWYSLLQGATGDGQSASPANPVTNIQGGALGYFSAHTAQTRQIIVQ